MPWYDCENSLDRFAECFGVYRIRVVTRSGEAVPIARLLGVDSKGLLYIGCSPSGQGIARRVKRNIKKHIKKAGCENVREWIAANDYRLQMKPTLLSTADEIKAKECGLLKNYKERSGELPPWNSNQGNAKSRESRTSRTK